MIKCSFCDEPAVRNYQKVWASWAILNGNKYSKDPRIEGTRQVIDSVPKNPDNFLACKYHEQEWLDGNLEHAYD